MFHAQYEHFYIEQYNDGNEVDMDTVEVLDEQQREIRFKQFRELMEVVSNGANVRPCKHIWTVINGNRSCFDKCK